ncbi:MAG: uroporphyrinogen decarboxylase family protein [Planctomycetota bacterium]|nr:uroporphyrinogen decarboxylase family protein [Planctomycetota bacterium]
MSKRKQYLRALRNERFDRLTWVPNFDYWLIVNAERGTVPAQYRDLSRNDLVRNVGGTIWSRVKTVSAHVPDIPTERQELGQGKWRETLHTNSGDLTTVYVTQGGEDHAVVLHEHPVKSVKDLPALLEVIRATKFKINPEPARMELEDVGQDGVILEPCPCIPFIQFGKTDTGWETGLYMWFDHRKAVDEVIEAYAELFLEEIRLTVEHSPAEIIHFGDNMDQLMVSPEIFTHYAAPFYKRAAEIIHSAGKLLEVHWCGRTGKLLPLLPDTGVNVVEAVVTEPMSELAVEDALKSLSGQVVMQGGLPSVLMCKEGGSREDLQRYVQHILKDIHPTQSFVLGMADNVPPNADFERVRIVSDLVAQAYG